MSASDSAPRRLLVLTSATGAGHDTHARATADWCARLYGNRVEVIIDHTLENSHWFYRGGVDFYNFIQRRMPWFHHLYYNLVEFIELFNPGTVSLGRDYYLRLLERTKPHAILSVMDCLNRGYFELAKEKLGPGLKCATYCTEFGGGYGFSRNWVNPRADFFFARTEEAGQEATRRKMSPARTRLAGHWAPPEFYDTPLGTESKAVYLRENLRLDPARFTLLLSTGGAGAQNHAAILRALIPLGDRLQIIALCGRDDVGRERLQAWAEASLPFPVRTLPFTAEMPRLLQVSSAVVARGGATTAGEALLTGCPMIFNCLGGIMPQEIPTWRYFENRGIGFAATRPAAVARVVQNWLDQPTVFAPLRDRMAHIRDATNPQAALELLLGPAPPFPSS
jgi:processive 1,2-diacylglycerol beta-glucosyltransferase